MKVATDLTVKGYVILFSTCEQLPFDLVAYKNGRFNRVQVKYRTVERGGTISVSFKSTSVYASGKRYSKPWDKAELDVLAVYCPDTDACYYLDPRDFAKSVSLRVVHAANNQRRGTHDAPSFVAPFF